MNLRTIAEQNLANGKAIDSLERNRKLKTKSYS